MNFEKIYFLPWLYSNSYSRFIFQKKLVLLSILILTILILVTRWPGGAEPRWRTRRLPLIACRWRWARYHYTIPRKTRRPDCIQVMVSSLRLSYIHMLLILKWLSKNYNLAWSIFFIINILGFIKWSKLQTYRCLIYKSIILLLNITRYRACSKLAR